MKEKTEERDRQSEAERKKGTRGADGLGVGFVGRGGAR